MKKLIAIITPVFLFSCGGDEDKISCTTSVEPAIEIEVYDSASQLPITCGAKATIQDGTFTQEVENTPDTDCDDSNMLTAADERAGNYDISISKEGYYEWNTYNVAVSENECHVNTVTIQAYLEKISPEDEIVACTTHIESGLWFELFDKETGERLHCDATITIEDGDYIEELVDCEGGSSGAGEGDLLIGVGAAPERAGVYNITIEKEGYQNWYRSNIEVSEGICHVNQVQIQAYLEK
ncbi:hypothetical protein RI845_06385 [Thalassotalea nanhaiensis]|uniref:Carboxypeptidase regulatory-like domain-containing protein n=1 Tax=Thalassotalea nanhaiensis TaxID=3065648 RepID=A0ABY9TPU7_9GAMM|nr:hypothetical protein RI845_06385 [Colwelliaceae bacterium SQ345]